MRRRWPSACTITHEGEDAEAARPAPVAAALADVLRASSMLPKKQASDEQHAHAVRRLLSARPLERGPMRSGRVHAHIVWK